jgi:hypothetical protein
MSKSHGRRRSSTNPYDRPGRENQPGRGPGTCAARRNPATNDPHGRRLQTARPVTRTARTSQSSISQSVESVETRGIENRKGDATTTAWVPRSSRTNAEAGSSGGRQPRTARRGQRTSKGCERNRMRDAPVDLSGAAKATGGQSTGPVTRDPRPSRTALESGAARRGQAPGERRDRRRTAQLDAPKGAEDASKPSPPDRTARPNPRDHGQADTPERSGRQYSPHVAQDARRWGPKACEPDGPPVIAAIL